jgi:molecular chaperone DnaJ
VVVHVDRHPVFGRKGDNVTLTLPVTFPEAALGAEVTVPTPDGTTVTLRVPPGTPSGRTFRVRGKGATRKDGSRGDLLASVEITVPRTSDGAAGETLAAYRDATSQDDPRAGLVDRAQSSKGARR